MCWIITRIIEWYWNEKCDALVRVEDICMEMRSTKVEQGDIMYLNGELELN